MARFLTLSSFVATLNYVSLANCLEYAIVGAGPAGYVVAERLSRNPDVNVTLLEAGPDASSDELVEVPAKYFYDQTYIWNYNVTANNSGPYIYNVSTNIWQGKALGGGTAVNAQIYSRGASLVFDDWAEISGNSGLAWESILDDFEQTTTYVREPINYTQPVDESLFSSGPLAVSLSPGLYSFDKPLASTFESMVGLEQIDLINGTGIGWTYGLASIFDNRTRSFAQNSFGLLMANRPNVQVLTNAFVSRIDFNGSTAQAVEYTNTTNDQTHRLEADEIIVTAGSIKSAQLLLLSGVGPQSDLRALDIPVVADIPNVGTNLAEHFYSVLQYTAAQSVETVWQWSDNATGEAEALAEYQQGGMGPLGEDNVGVMAFQRLNDSVFESVNSSYYLGFPADRPQIAYLSATTPFIRGSPNESIVAAFAAVLQPESRGTVRLNTSDYRDAPLIEFNIYGTPGDKAAILAGYKTLRSIMGADALKPYLLEEIYPGSDVTTDDQLFEAIHNSIAVWHHPVGTTALGTVLDSDWRVSGLNGLRVVGAGAMPTIPTCPIQAAVYALAHRAAEDIYQADVSS